MQSLAKRAHVAGLAAWQVKTAAQMGALIVTAGQPHRSSTTGYSWLCAYWDDLCGPDFFFGPVRLYLRAAWPYIESAHLYKKSDK